MLQQPYVLFSPLAASLLNLHRSRHHHRQRPIKVQVEGLTSAHGKNDYNMALGERRANAVKEFLVKEGIAADRLTTISYGETRLAMPETPTTKNQNSSESIENRRVHFEVISK